MNNYFCVLPFFGYEYNSGSPGTHCCLLPVNYNIEEIRKSILNGQRSDFCSACWKLEDRGLVSDRLLKNTALDFYWDRDIRYIEDDVKQGKYKTIMVKNYTSNTCNSTCVTCNSSASSAWGAVERRLNRIPIKPHTMTMEQIDTNLQYKELVTLNLLGGEPLYEQLNFQILEKLVQHNNTNCFIAITTNGSVNLTSNQQNLLKKFKNVNFNISIDGTGSVFEYMRYPLKWDQLLTNLDLFRTITDNVSVSYTTSNLNLLYHHDIINWFTQQKLKYHYNPVTNPRHFSPSALPKSVKDDLFKQHGYTNDLKFFIGKEHTAQDDINFQKMITTVQDQDRVKNISIQDYLPELYDLIRHFF